MEPEEFICPITQVTMVDPVLASDGRTYERSAITEWLRTHSTSPITRETMHQQSLTPNYALKSMIERHRVPKPNQIQQDHSYAIKIFQEENTSYQSLPATPIIVSQPTQQTNQTNQINQTKQKKMLAILFCTAILIMVLVFILRTE